MKIFGLAVLLAGSLAAPAFAQAPRPKLLVVVSVDQLSTDLFNEYRPRFTGGLKRVADGVVFANGYQAHGATETCPGHSTILTGNHPARTGIIANDWTDLGAPRDDKRVYCAEDERVAGSNSRQYTVSDIHLKVPTLGDRMKRVDPGTRVVAVAGKDRAAAMMGGHNSDQRWWWGGDRFVQNSSAAPAPVAAAVNIAVAKAIAAPRPAMPVPAFCADKNQAVPIGAGKTVGTFRFERAAGDARAFSAGPELDAATLAMAAALTQQMQLGRGTGTDILAIGLSGTDYVGHRYGTRGVEMCLQLTSLDRDMAGFFAFLDRSGVDYTVALTADHGGLDLPERQRLQGVTAAARVDPALSPENVGKAVAGRLGLTAPVFVGEWYVASTVPAARRREVIDAARQILRVHPQVDSVFIKPELAAHPLPNGPPESWSVLDRLRASFDPARSGDLALVLKPNITPIVDPTGGYVATHGSVWDYDRKVPIAFWWKGIAAENRGESAMTVDIVPTLAGMVRLGIPAGEIDGRCLDIVAGAGSNCR